MMSEAIKRSHLKATANPDQMLSDLLGPAFISYRQAFASAEKGIRPDHPLHLDVDVTTACNFQCPMCPAGEAGHNFPGFHKGCHLDRDLYRQALAEGQSFGLPSVRLGMTGEPLLVADIDQWVREAADAGVLDISLITNARLLTPALSHRLIEAGLTRLMISVDAATAETYSRVRPGGDWNLLLDNIRAFLRLRAETAKALPLLRVSFVEMTTNQSDLNAFADLFGPLADYISFQRYQNILGQPETDFALKKNGRPTGFCSEPFTRLALHADGGLFPCCSDFGRRKPLGNLAAGGLLATWQSAEAVFLTTPEAGQADPCCFCLAGSD